MGDVVSVCIPTYRSEAFIAETLRSVLAQSHRDIEVVVVDDNSPDATDAVVKAIASSDPRVSYHRNPVNLGPEGNWNRCLSLARGDYFKLLPHDDLLAPGCLAEQVGVLRADTARRVALVFGRRRIVGPDGRLIMERGLPRVPAGVVDRHRLVRLCVRAGGNLIGEPGNGLARMDDVRTLGRYDGTHPYVIDMDFWFRLLGHGDAHYTATWSSTFRVSASSWSVAIGRRQAVDFDGLAKRARDEMGFALSAADLAVGAAASRASTVARRLVYATVLRRARA